MKCNRCGREMRTKDVYIGDDDYGDPIYNEYAFCDSCKIKKNIEHKRNNTKPKKRGYTGLEEIEDDYEPSSRSRSPKAASGNKSSKKQNGGCLNALIKLFAILIIIMIIFVVILFNKDKIPFIKDLGTSSSQTSSIVIPQNSFNNTDTKTV